MRSERAPTSTRWPGLGPDAGRCAASACCSKVGEGQISWLWPVVDMAVVVKTVKRDTILVGEFTTHPRTYFSGEIGMFTGGTIWILTHGHIPSTVGFMGNCKLGNTTFAGLYV